MRKEVLDGVTTKTYQVKKGDDPRYMVLQNVSVNSKVKAEIKRETDPDQKLFNTTKVITLLEGQNKIEHIVTKAILKQFELATVKDTTDVDKVVIKEAKLDLAYGGEITLGQNDTIDIKAENLEKIADSSLYTFEGVKVAGIPYIVKEQTYKADQVQKEIDLLNVDFLMFHIDALPTKVELRVKGQKVTRTSEALLIDQKDVFNTIGYDENGKAIFGTYKTVVLDVRGAESVYLEDEREPRIDIKYHTVKLPN